MRTTREEATDDHITIHAKCHMHSRVNQHDIDAMFTQQQGHDSYRNNELLDMYNLLHGVDEQGPYYTRAAVSNDELTLSSGSIVYAFTLPYIAGAYCRATDWAGLIRNGGAEARLQRFSLFMVRPSIEHYMLGIIVGRGGTGELGATLWGQTELSCYDDAMHGKWGMNYKYHARAVVFNEKHLLRLWDISFNGYTGGMGTSLVDWENKEDWHDATNALDEPLKHNFPDMFVMRFSPEEVLDGNLPNPVNFNSKPGADVGEPSAAMADPENIYNTHQDSMDVFRKLTGVNPARYAAYHTLMPKYALMHAGRKTAGHSSHEGDTHTASLSFSGTMQIKQNQTGQIIHETRGTGHCGDSYAGSASIRAGNGSMAQGNPAAFRVM
jgi:hypothetical protein